MDHSPMIHERLMRLVADWLADQADNGFDGYVEYLLPGDLSWDENWYDALISMGRAAADQIARDAHTAPPSPLTRAQLSPDS